MRKKYKKFPIQLNTEIGKNLKPSIMSLTNNTEGVSIISDDETAHFVIDLGCKKQKDVKDKGLNMFYNNFNNCDTQPEKTIYSELIDQFKYLSDYYKKAESLSECFNDTINEASENKEYIRCENISCVASKLVDAVIASVDLKYRVSDFIDMRPLALDSNENQECGKYICEAIDIIGEINDFLCDANKLYNKAFEEVARYKMLQKHRKKYLK